MWLDFVLAAVHHVLVFSLFAIIAVELLLAKPGIDRAGLARLTRVDSLYGLFSGLVIAAGFSRAIWGLKGWDYYAGNPVFWAKVAAFLLVGLLSIVPTRAFLRWSKRATADPADLPSGPEIRTVRTWMHLETTVLILIPVIAAALARGIGD
jgi:putative membrane protein